MATERMYELAFQFKRTKLWKQLFDDEIFAVRLSDGEIGYCCVMGQLGEHIALSLHIGQNGLDSYRRLAFSEPGEAYMNPEIMLTQDCLQCAFENSDMLSEEETNEVLAYAEANGLKLRGKNAFPQFVKYRPNCHPWRYDSPQDEVRICDALSAAIALADILKSYTKEDIRLPRMGRETEKIPMLAMENGRIALKYTILPPEAEIMFPAPRLANDVTVARMKKLKPFGTMECQITLLPTPVQDDETGAPWYPFILLCADREREAIINVPPVRDYEENAGDLLNSFAEALLKENRRPKTILTEDARSETFLREFCTQLGINLKMESELRLLEGARESLLEDLWPDEMDFAPDFPDIEMDSPEALKMLGELANALKVLEREISEEETAPFPDAFPAPVNRTARKSSPRSRGNCYLCGASYTKGGFGRHFASKHGYSGKDAQECVLVKIESARDNDYWLFLDLPVTSTLKTLDAFLREIWLECCGHMSAFFLGVYDEAGMGRKLSSFPIGTVLRYEYDFGDTTELRITIADRIRRPKQKKAVRLLARNEKYTFPCAECGAPAELICCECLWEGTPPFLCRSCAEKHAHDSMLPATNSPRMGVCGYCGELDRYEFNPADVES